MRRWLFITFLALLWQAAWLLLWQVYLFEALELSSAPDTTVFNDSTGGSRTLWVVSGIGFGMVLIGVRVAFSGRELLRGARIRGAVLLAAGATPALLGLSVSFLFPSVTSLIIDEPERTVTHRTGWLYWETQEKLGFDEIERIVWRDDRRRVGRTGNACQRFSHLKLFRFDGTVMQLAGDLRSESMAVSIADASEAPFFRTGIQEC